MDMMWATTQHRDAPLFGRNGPPDLRCPGCGDTYLHHREVDVYMQGARGRAVRPPARHPARNGRERAAHRRQSVVEPRRRLDLADLRKLLCAQPARRRPAQGRDRGHARGDRDGHRAPGRRGPAGRAGRPPITRRPALWGGERRPELPKPRSWFMRETPPQFKASRGPCEGGHSPNRLTPEAALRAIVRALGGQHSGRAFSCHCPIHGDGHAASRSGSPCGQILVHCHAGCDAGETSRTSARASSGPITQRPGPGRRPPRKTTPTGASAIARPRGSGAKRCRSRSRRARCTCSHWRAIDAPLGPRLRWHWKDFALVALITEAITDRPIGVQVTPLSRPPTGARGGAPSSGRAPTGSCGSSTGPACWCSARGSRRRCPASP